MGRVQAIVTTFGVIAAMLPRTAGAQAVNDDAAFVMVPGFVYQHATFGDDNPKSRSGAGVTIGAQIRGPRSGSRTLVFEGTFQPNALENPAMRLVATGPTPRRALAVIVYDASQPPTTRMEGEATPKLMSCK